MSVYGGVLQASQSISRKRQAEASVPSQRSLLVDVVRGLAISLVAFGHTNQGVMHRAWWGQSQVGWRLDRFIYAFHMPAFFFVSGIFIASSVAKRGPGRFVTTKVSQMLYPYVLWAVLQYVSIFPLHRFMNAKQPPLQTFLFDLVTGSTLWFLPAIFCCVVLGMLLRKVNKPLLFAMAVAVSLLQIHSPVFFLVSTLLHFPFLVAGMWVSQGYERLERISLPAAGAGALALAVLVYFATESGFTYGRWTAVPVGLAGTAMLFLLARCLRKDALARTLAWAGEASFGIYLLSSYGQGLGREALLRGLHTTEPLLQLVVPSLVAILLPAWIYQHRVRLRVAWMFLWPF